MPSSNAGTLPCCPNLQDRADRRDWATIFAVLGHLQEGRIDGLRGERIGVHGLPGVGPLQKRKGLKSVKVWGSITAPYYPEPRV